MFSSNYKFQTLYEISFIVKVHLIIHLYFRRAFVYMFPFNAIEWVKRVLLAGVMSVLIGTIFLGVRWQYWNEVFLLDQDIDKDLFLQANVGGKWIILNYIE